MKPSDRVSADIEKYGMIKDGDRVLVALSGGPDSVYLLCYLLEIRESRALTLFAAHVNHNLRGAESDGDEAFCRDLCGRFGVPLEVLSADVKKAAKEAGKGVEEAARDIRYAFFEKTADRFACDKIALAHNADDNAETVIWNITRGSGVKGISGIPPVRGRIIRPLIGLPKSEIKESLEKRGIEYRVDSTNEETVYTRNKIRRRVIPELKELNPSFLEAVSRLSEAAREDERFICEAAAAVETDDVSEIAALPKALKNRVIAARIEKACGFTADSGMVERVAALLESGKTSKSAVLKNGRLAGINKGKLVFPGKEAESFEKTPLENGENIIDGRAVGVVEKEDAVEVAFAGEKIKIKREKIAGRLYARSRGEGDRFRLHGVNRALKRLLIDRKIPREERNGLLVVSDDEKIYYVEKIGRSDFVG